MVHLKSNFLCKISCKIRPVSKLAMSQWLCITINFILKIIQLTQTNLSVKLEKFSAKQNCRTLLNPNDEVLQYIQKNESERSRSIFIQFQSCASSDAFILNNFE